MATANGTKRRAATPAHGRKALVVEPEIRAANLRRLRRIEGQVRGLQKMVADDRYCAYILVQIASVQEALRAVARELMRNHLHHCASTSIRNGDAREAERMSDELAQLFHKFAR
jgi:DNA-binding FrmR family transcriptional regulator